MSSNGRAHARCSRARLARVPGITFLLRISMTAAVPYTWLVNPSGGLVAGDHLSVEAQLHARTHVFMTSPSANRVYRSLAEPTVQEVRLSVGPDARLEWVPEITIPFAGSRFRQSIHVDLAPGATVVLWDAMASGRVARHERWAFASLENEICISGSLGKSVAERYRLVPGLLPESVGLVGSWDYVASLFIIGDAVDAMCGHVSTACLLRPWRSAPAWCWERSQFPQFLVWWLNWSLDLRRISRRCRRPCGRRSGKSCGVFRPRICGGIE